jgi:glycosyltransferase involved in cell wall biosynthesis
MMRKIRTALVFGPNGGQSLDYGGAAYVTLLIANALSQMASSVFVLAARGLSRDRLEEVHGVRLDKSVQVLYANQIIEKRMLSAISLSSRILVNAVRSCFDRRGVELVIFGDDAPKQLVPFFRKKGSVIINYAHLPLFVRASYPRIGYWCYEHSLLVPAALLYWKNEFANPSEYDLNIANSSVTSDLLKAVGVKNVRILHPPARRYIGKLTAKLPIILHAAQYGKGFDRKLAVSILKESQRRRIPFKWVFLRGSSAPNAIKRMARKMDNVNLYDFLPDDMYSKILSEASVILNLRYLEPFGISTVEAMSAGAIPAILRSRFNGSWLDVCAKNNVGLGIEDPIVFVDWLEKLQEENFRGSCSELALSISNAFVPTKFTSGLINIIDSIV